MTARAAAQVESWRPFAEQVFERRHAVLADPRGLDAEAAGRLFAALRAALRRADPEAAGITVWVEGRLVPDAADFLPVASDDGLADYLQRVAKEADEREFTVLFANPHMHDRAFWTAARHATRSIAALRGLPCGGFDTCAFLGRYRKTPFGVHRGQMSVLTFPLIGTKRFLLWPYEYGIAHPDIQDSLDYHRHLSVAAVEEAQHGYMLYWPSDYWHIAEGTGEISAAWNIGFWWDRPAIQRVMAELADRLTQHRLADDFDTPTLPLGNASAAMPDEIEVVLAALLETAGATALRESLQLDWLRFTSGDGFREVPAPLPFHVDDADTLRVDPAATIRTHRLDSDRIAVAALGQVDVFAVHQDMLMLLHRIVVGEPVRRPDVAAAPDLVHFLGAAGALVREGR